MDPRPKILICDDDALTRKLLHRALEMKQEYQVAAASGGKEAFELITTDPPDLLITDLLMPEMDGRQLVEEVRAVRNLKHLFIIMLTSQEEMAEKVRLLNLGVDDYIVKPAAPEEIRARVNAGLRIVNLQKELMDANDKLRRKITELEKADERIYELTGLLPVCAWCKKVKNHASYWEDVEQYLHKTREVKVTHGICPDCAKKWKKEWKQG